MASTSTDFTLLLTHVSPRGLFHNCVREAVLQQDGAPAHYGLPVREYLDDIFSGGRVRRGSDMVWHPRRPDLTTCDNSHLVTVKEKMSHLRLTTVEDIKTAIRDCFNDFQPSAWKKMSGITRGKTKICAENGGEHTGNFYLACIGTLWSLCTQCRSVRHLRKHPRWPKILRPLYSHLQPWKRQRQGHHTK
jgi:hypothetical protein